MEWLGSGISGLKNVNIEKYLFKLKALFRRNIAQAMVSCLLNSGVFYLELAIRLLDLQIETSQRSLLLRNNHLLRHKGRVEVTYCERKISLILNRNSDA